MRDNQYLADKLYFLWENYFVDVPRKNPVLIKFSKKSYRQLGCITWAKSNTRGVKSLLSQLNEDYDDKRISLINITGYFRDEDIPDEVVMGTIAHEMIHYAHGFHSPLQQLYDHPHKGGVIRKEMVKRDLGDLYQFARKWLKANWQSYIKTNK